MIIYTILLTMWVALHQAMAIFKKNLRRSLHSKKKLLSHFIFPLIICLIYYFSKTQSQPSPSSAALPAPQPVQVIVNFLLTLYVGLINSSTLKETITLFICEREEGVRQYQYVMGVGKGLYTVSNLFYSMVFTSVFLLPFYLLLIFYEWKWVYIWNFGCFVISSTTLSMSLTCLFKEHKVASEIIGILFSMCSFLPLVYTPSTPSLKYYLARTLPNSSFAISLLSPGASADSLESFYISLTSLLAVKLYLLVYALGEFRGDVGDSAKQCWAGFKGFCERVIGRGESKESSQYLRQQEIETNSDEKMDARKTRDSTDVSLELIDVVKMFGNFGAVKGVSFTVRKGEIFGLLGRNGAGKTTIIDMITKVTSPTSGKIEYHTGTGTSTTVPHLGICYQHQILYEDLTIKEHLQLYSYLKPPSAWSPNTYPHPYSHLLSTLQLSESDLNKKVSELSGGTKRKLSFCIALLSNPPLLLLDEPTSGLDPLSRRNIWKILQQIKTQAPSPSTDGSPRPPISIILTSHHLDEVEVLADWVCIVGAGRVRREGTVASILAGGGAGSGVFVGLHLCQSEKMAMEGMGEQRDLEANMSFDPQVYTDILLSIIPADHLKIVDQTKQSIKYFLTYNESSQNSSPPTSTSISYSDIIQCIQKLQEFDNISVVLEANNLQQSFIAMEAADEGEVRPQRQESGSSIVDVEGGQGRDRVQDMGTRLGCLSLCVSQIKAIMLKNFYCLIYKYHYIYTLNITILLLYTLINTLLISKLTQSKDPQSSESKTALTSSSSSTSPLFIMQGYVFLSSAYTSLPVYEKQHKIMPLMLTRGLSRPVYWIGCFIFDWIYFVINYLALTLIFGVLFVDMPLWVLLGSGAAIVAYSYVLSTLFQNVKTANNWVGVGGGLGLALAVGVALTGNQVTGVGRVVVVAVRYLFPFYDMLQSSLKQDPTLSTLSALSSPSAPTTYYCLYCFLIHFTLLVAIESKIVRILWYWVRSRGDAENRLAVVHEDIALNGVAKVFGQVEALRDVSYVIGEDEHVALLGHNGSGKSTTFSLLSSQQNPTSGSLYLEHTLKYPPCPSSSGCQSLPLSNTLSSCGMCPQEDTLWEFLTPQQIITVFCLLIGVEGAEQQAANIWAQFDLETDVKGKKLEQLSGGNKRKICMGVCILGKPRVKLLDECSTGLDPISRMAMVEVLKGRTGQGARRKTVNRERYFGNEGVCQGRGIIVFTTHSMSQAEKLCERVIIMKSGRVCQDDLVFKLKQKYYDCYWVEIEDWNQPYPEKQNSSKSALPTTLFPSAPHLANHLHEQLPSLIDAKKMRLQIPKKQIRLSELMRSLQSAKSEQLIGSFKIMEPMLEDVYLRVTGESNTQAGQGEERGLEMENEMVEL